MRKTLLVLFLLTALVLCSCSDAKFENLEEDKNILGSETELTINPGEWQLPGTLTIPDGKGTFPVVIFVHGSGPSDRDETMGKQKLFKDLSSDLAKLGIASIRYDKRTYVYGEKMAENIDLTVKEETVDDVFYAIEAIKTNPQIDISQIYVAGHSLGGYLIPQIDKADVNNAICGYIFLAGSVRSVTELTLEQIDYILSLDNETSEADKTAAKKQYVDLIDKINALTDKDKGDNNELLGAHPTYWLDLKGYQPDVDVLNIREPMLFLQGEHDYQVTMTDFNLWKEALKNNQKAAFKLYKDLTHSFVKTEEMGTPSDYNILAKVDSQVAIDISEFIFSGIKTN